MMRRLLIALMALVMIGGVAGVAMAQNDSSAAKPGDVPGNGGNCGDGIDNDGDELIDAADPGCDQPGCEPSGIQPKKCQEDTDSVPVDDCEDGLDNEPDGFTDAEDPDCQEGGSGDETNDDSPLDDCEDGLDNEPDGFTDAEDPDCQEGGSGDETNDDSPGVPTCTTRGLLGIIDNPGDGVDDDDTLAYGLLGTENEGGALSGALHDLEAQIPIPVVDQVVHEGSCVAATLGL
jgi:hypothetical protein